MKLVQGLNEDRVFDYRVGGEVQFEVGDREFYAEWVDLSAEAQQFLQDLNTAQETFLDLMEALLLNGVGSISQIRDKWIDTASPIFDMLIKLGLRESLPMH